ncbi:hypothetical protein ACE7GA_27260 (plasmid) [Roseomonas sp. CCTCC AB2023176]|uniref:hypothetical protein n=1 Tax=Roseomonas sp. CCTCC AB2023176 TaxID=3342640 RepID=UPI0035DCC17E
MNPADRAIHAADAIRDLLTGTLDDCARALARGDVQAAQRELQAAMERLRRVRRDLAD